MLHFVHRWIIPAAYSLLPSEMESPEATVLLLAIGSQESRFKHRRQIGGPAVGFFQFERAGGVEGVLTHHATEQHAREVCEILGYEPDPWKVYGVLADNDILAAVFARLLLYSHPQQLPSADEPEVAWKYYRSTWRPGRPHRQTWDRFHARACEIVYPAYSSGE